MQLDTYVSERRRKQSKRRGYFWGVAAFLAAYFIFLGLFMFIVRLPAFRASRITIQGESAVSESDIMNLLMASVTRTNALANAKESGVKALLGFKNMLIWPDALPSSTVALIPRLAGVTISKDYFLHTITVTVTERQPFAVWCTMPEDSCVWFDEHGTAFGRAYDTQGNAILVIHDHTQKKPKLGGAVLSAAFMQNLISIVGVLKKSSLDVQDVSINDLSLQQVDVTLANGPAMHFSLRFPADDDLTVINNLMAKPGFAALQYVDFTVENRAYYK